jgi:hypothetical protein
LLEFVALECKVVPSSWARSLERRLQDALRDAERYRAKRDMDHADWLERVASVGGGPNQSKEEYFAGYDAEMDECIIDAALAEKGKP